MLETLVLDLLKIAKIAKKNIFLVCNETHVTQEMSPCKYYIYKYSLVFKTSFKYSVCSL